ncbi:MULTISPECIES: bifunctional glycosyltransferase/CDP-glycerol:glycerophosphate glycerophosphotransferase [unclassified Leifsonia]|uniref:bifunctional glycosyltransferase/CDP-glycerol:glycerophosphate glycerophosphotransferase n=1 Tax=unclassified Leifsonia TaxID=2663824 RepID=UPI0006F74BA2|nr:MULTISPECIES: CDP-glycerol glycerophosphotransferase family protein [unclassified Leifsonia]KQX06417.1 hypothetical protein ASC59_00605 [Leifsonia sp. Root1293]KRA10700.1 hypothetical protein ASD61_00605 [Leifsonia sp. Root60]
MNLKYAALKVLGRPSLLPARDAARKSRAWATGAVRRTRIIARPQAIQPGLLSIVVPVYNVEQFIRAALDSLLKQTYRDIEVIVVDDGGTDGSVDIAKRMARLDPRIRIVHRENGGLGAARNTGADHAHGEFIAFIDSDDTVSRHAFTPVIAALRESGSDMAVSPYRRLVRGQEHAAGPWIYRAHEIERLGTRLIDFPEIQANAVAWSKVYRRRFWLENDLAFPEGILYEDQPVSTRAYALAKGIDVLTAPTVNWRVREDGTSISQSVLSTRNVEDHIAVALTSLDTLEHEGLLEARDVRLQQLLTNDYSHPLVLLPDADDEQWDTFTASLKRLLDRADDRPSVWRHVPARNKIAFELIRNDRRADFEAFLAAGGWRQDAYPTEVAGERVRVEAPLRRTLLADLPDEVFELSDFETRLRSETQKVSWSSDTEVEIQGWAAISNVDPAVNRVDISAEIVGRNTGVRHPAAVDFAFDPLQSSAFSTANTDGSKAHFALRFDAAVLAAEPDEYQIILTLTCARLSRTRALHFHRRGGESEARLVNGALIDFTEDRLGYLAVRAFQPRASVHGYTYSGRRIGITITGQDLQSIAIVRTDDRFAVPLGKTPLKSAPGTPGEYTATIVVPAEGPVAWGGNYTQRVWRVEVETGDGSWIPVISPVTVPLRAASRDLAQNLVLERRVGGSLLEDRANIGREGRIYLPGSATLLVERVRCAEIVGVDVTENAITLTVRSTGMDESKMQVQLRSSKFQFDAELAPIGPGLLSATVSTEQAFWGNDPTTIPTDHYHVAVLDSKATVFPLVSGELSREMPTTTLFPRARVSAQRSPSGRLNVIVEPPLANYEIGPYNQAVLKQDAAELEVNDRPGQRAVLFRCLYGEVANDTAEAVHHELRRRGSALQLLWATKTTSVPIPEGGRRVIEGSGAFYRAMSESKYVMVNVHQPDWFKKNEGQVLIETFHGYPFKLAGRRHWAASKLPESRVASFYERALEWDYLLSPSAYASDLLREFLPEKEEWSGTMLEIGYPRNDALLAPEASEIGLATRRRLGIPDDHTVVLYGPTYRDYLSLDEFRARPMTALDVRGLARQLGDTHTFLVRGHVMNSRVGYNVKGASIIDVTDHPSITELILASDAAILDYSSLRFDYALTGKPMIFFTPDREQYFDSREPMIPYEGTAPGPWLTTTAEVLDAVQNLDSVAAEYSAAVAEFRRRFMEKDDGHAAGRLVDEVFVPRGDAT